MAWPFMGSGRRNDVANQCSEFAQNDDSGGYKFPAAPAGNRTRDLSITSQTNGA